VAMKITKPPILPGNSKDPTGIDRLERGAMKEFARRMKKVGNAYAAALERFPATLAVNARYEYQLDPVLLTMTLNDASILVDTVLLEGEQTFANLTQQSAVYAADRESLQALLMSDPYQRRMELVYARTFEEMKGLTATTKRNMARVLTDGIGRGISPREVARNLRDQVGAETRRANTIARTEMTGALRRARWDEATEARDVLGLRIKLLHQSALSPTTRQSHAIRHAHLYTVEEVREWYSIGANAINCKCMQVEALVDEKGNPLNPKVIELSRKEFEAQWQKMAANKSLCHCCAKAA